MENISESDIVVQERIYYQAGRVEVFKVKHIRTGRTLCMKKVFVNNIQEATAMQSEYLAMATLQHENIVKLVSASLGGQDKTITHLLIFSEYCEEGDLENLIKRCATHQYYFPEDQLISYLEMLVDAFLYMQNKNLAHRDIKPQNIFVCENATKLKVGDLGSVSQQEDSVVNNIVGTPLYLSPILREAYSRNVQFGGIPHDVYKSDVYSLGLTFLYLSSLSPVNDLINLSDMERKTEQRILALRKSYPRLSEILKGMLMKDEYFRFDYTNIKYRVNRGRTVLELLDTKNYEKITRQGKGKIEFSNLKCHGCLTIQNEDDLFVYFNGLLCKTCRESLVQNPEKEKLFHLNHYLKNAPENCSCRRFCEYCHKLHDNNVTCLESSKNQRDSLRFVCSLCSESFVFIETGSIFGWCSNVHLNDQSSLETVSSSHYYCLVCLKLFNESSHIICKIVFRGFFLRRL